MSWCTHIQMLPTSLECDNDRDDCAALQPTHPTANLWSRRRNPNPESSTNTEKEVWVSEEEEGAELQIVRSDSRNLQLMEKWGKKRRREREERREEDLETRFSLGGGGGGGRGVFSLAGRLTLRATYNYRMTRGWMTCKLELGAWKRQKDKRNDHRPTMPVNFENQLQSPVGSAKSINPRCCEWDSKIVSKYTCCILEVAGTILNYVCHDEVRLPSFVATL